MTTPTPTAVTDTAVTERANEKVPMRSVEFNHLPMTVIRALLKKHDHVCIVGLGILSIIPLVVCCVFSTFWMIWAVWGVVIAGSIALAWSLRLYAEGRTGLVKFDSTGMSINRPERPSLLLPWQALRHADLKKKSNTAGWNEARLLLCFEEGLLPADLETVSPWWMERGRTGECVIDIDLRAVAKRDHLKLIGVLTRLLPPGRVSKNLLTYVSPEHNPSFTELWSESLMLAGRRSSATQLSPGDWLNDYRFEVVSILGAGGQGTAYEAIDHFPVQPGASRVVLKEFVLPVHGDFEAAASALALVQHEASIIRSLNAEFAVKFYDLFVEDCRAYLVREFVDGMSLKEMVENAGSLSLAQVCRLGVSMCEILDHLHTRVPPIIHRDFTPDNLLLSDNLKLIDFDIARFDNAGRSNQVVGKPNYLSPEQFRGQATAQSDIYSLGATLFFLSTGRQPMPISASHPRSACPSLCEQFDAIVARATDVDCANRYASAMVLRQELINLLEENDATL